MVQRPATIETKRLRLLALLADDVEALGAGDAERASRVVGVTFPPGWPEDRETREGLPWHLRHLQADAAHSPWRIRVIVERVSGSVVGSINLKGPPNTIGDVEIGWGMVERCRSRGYALEAASALVAWAAAQPGVRSVSATVPSDNVASQRLAAKLGMVLTSDIRRALPVWRLELQDPVGTAAHDHLQV
jgi:ribosomal-protein-alanine N-acetyltransferase